MRYAIISDIHSNLEALQAVAAALSKESVDAYLCLGDIVGYGSDPSECIKLVRSLKPRASIAGNHEWGVLGLTSLDNFSEDARDAINWTRSAIGPAEKRYLKLFGVIHEDKVFTLVHGSPEDPKSFKYILNIGDAYDAMLSMKNNLCFVGHSHAAGIFYSDGDIMRYSKGPAIGVKGGERYIINVGSVGQPRDGDPRAAFCIYDSKENSVEIRRVQYDVKTAQDKILKAGLPVRLACRLSEGI